MAVTYLLLGSNQGNREYFLEKAQTHLSRSVGTVQQASAVYETAAWGVAEQPAFLNQVIQINTYLAPTELLISINKIEQDLGRIRETRWGARVIDIDILLYDDLVLQTETLIIPHIQLPNRRFALVPLTQIAPDLVHPAINETMAQLLQKCPDPLPVNLFKPV